MHVKMHWPLSMYSVKPTSGTFVGNQIHKALKACSSIICRHVHEATSIMSYVCLLSNRCWKHRWYPFFKYCHMGFGFLGEQVLKAFTHILTYGEMSSHQSCKSNIVAFFGMNCIQLLKNSTLFLFLDFSGLCSG